MDHILIRMLLLSQPLFPWYPVCHCAWGNFLLQEQLRNNVKQYFCEFLCRPNVGLLKCAQSLHESYESIQDLRKYFKSKYLRAHNTFFEPDTEVLKIVDVSFEGQKMPVVEALKQVKLMEPSC